MKRKIIGLLGTLLFIGNLCACGDGKNVNESNNSAVFVEESTEQAKEKNVKVEESVDNQTVTPEGLEYVYIEDCFGYSINVMPNYNTAMGYGFVSYEGDMSRSEVIYITQYSGEVGDEEQLERIDMSQYEDSTDIFDLLIGNIDHELYAASGYSLVGSDVSIVETKDVNGIEMTKFEGTITAYQKDVQQEFSFPIVAYGIKSSKTPILVSCIDRTKDSSRHEIWVDKIDDVVSTFKDGE